MTAHHNSTKLLRRCPNVLKHELLRASHGLHHHHLSCLLLQADPLCPRPHVQVVPQLPHGRRAFTVMNGMMGPPLLPSRQKTTGNSRSTSCMRRTCRYQTKSQRCQMPDMVEPDRPSRNIIAEHRVGRPTNYIIHCQLLIPRYVWLKSCQISTRMA
jgi:hypothetical protein